MKILIIDTETTGLPKKNVVPYIIQLSFILFDCDKLDIIYKFDEYIKIAENVNISEDSIKIHNINKNITDKLGIPIEYALHTLNYIINITDAIVGHNISFDYKMLINEYNRNKIINNLMNKKTMCTMKNYTSLCKIPKSNPNYIGYKYPKLSELYEFLFSYPPDNLHNSYNDILICLRCYYYIEYNKDLLIHSNDFINEYIKHFNPGLPCVSIYS